MHDDTITWQEPSYLDEALSTNLLADGLGCQGAPAGTVIVADHQTGGRGRNGHVWFSPAGRNLYVSLLLRPRCQPAQVPQLAILTAIAIRRAILGRFPQLPIVIKWPNDVWCGTRKCCGILCSMSCQGSSTDYAVVGFGVNVLLTKDEMPPEIQNLATSLVMETGVALDRQEFLQDILASFKDCYDAWSLANYTLAPFLDEWNGASLLNGRRIGVEQGMEILEGIAQGITPDGQLILLTSQGPRHIIAGETHIRL